MDRRHAQSFKRQHAPITDAIDDRLDLLQIRINFFSPVADFFFNLPGDRVRHQLFDLLIRIVRTEASHIQNIAEPSLRFWCSIHRIYQANRLVGRLQKIVVLLQAPESRRGACHIPRIPPKLRNPIRASASSKVWPLGPCPHAGEDTRNYRRAPNLLATSIQSFTIRTSRLRASASATAKSLRTPVPLICTPFRKAVFLKL